MAPARLINTTLHATLRPSKWGCAMRFKSVILAISLGVAWANTATFAMAQSAMQAFKSDADLRAFFRAKEEAKYGARPSSGSSPNLAVMYQAIPPPPPPALAMASMEPATAPQEVIVTGSRISPPGNSASTNITNRQEADVDEGGIVKVHGNHLVVLRRGRLFTVSIADSTMTPIATVNAFPPRTTGQGAWYDEMLVAGDIIAVIGYSYERVGTEVNRFTISADGKMTYLDTHHLRSDDYYSSSNYASRLVGNKLVYYTGLSFDPEEINDSTPSVRRWRTNAEGTFRRVISARRIYAPASVRSRKDANITTLHSVTSCDLVSRNFTCTASAVLGSESRSFYVSGTAVYVWISDAFTNTNRPRSMVYRLPLNGGTPSAIMARGGPKDQFSFREDRADGILNVIVRAESRGDGMWRSRVNEGDVALLRLPISQFGDGSRAAATRRYRGLPSGDSSESEFKNRYAGSWLLYSEGEPSSDDETYDLNAVPLGGGPIRHLKVPHAIERLDLLGADAVAIGSDNSDALGFSSIRLDGLARLGDTYILPATRQGESRSQAFFYRSDSPDGATGLLGLPVARRVTQGDSDLGISSAIAFLQRNNRQFSPVGDLEANFAISTRDDGCQASCVDWYGNARPIFLGGRIFALMGYELVEGQLVDGKIKEVGRANFSPPNLTPAAAK